MCELGPCEAAPRVHAEPDIAHNHANLQQQLCCRNGYTRQVSWMIRIRVVHKQHVKVDGSRIQDDVQTEECRCQRRNACEQIPAQPPHEPIIRSSQHEGRRRGRLEPRLIGESRECVHEANGLASTGRFLPRASCWRLVLLRHRIPPSQAGSRHPPISVIRESAITRLSESVALLGLWRLCARSAPIASRQRSRGSTYRAG